jgi:hydrogenase maturation protein HypF
MEEHRDRLRCRIIRVGGTVQGVGFRPFIYRLAARLGVRGTVRNDGRGVEIIAWAAPETLDRFAGLIRREAPPLAAVAFFRMEEVPAPGALPATFSIDQSAAPGGAGVDTAADTAVCAACLAEMRDPADRRVGHAFINCTDCGPRYTIIGGLPYDRPKTAMAGFAMCPACRAEYGDPASRRFHAQAICCPDCGPRYALLDRGGRALEGADPVARCIELLRQGDIAAIKGIGGFHLSCRADRADSVARLRLLKNREEKPLALMVRDRAAAAALVHLSDEEALLLESPERPIVLARKRKSPGFAVADEVAPRVPTYGIMLPYAPLHHLLFAAGAFDALVMTSANRSDEPMVHTNEAAVKVLGGVADVFLVHDRPILVRVDDAIARIAAGAPLLLRRGRGYVPEPVPSPCEVTGIVGCGGVLKSTIAVGRGSSCYVSQYVGSADNAETLDQASALRHHLLTLLDTRASLYVIDRHPGTPLEHLLEPGVPTLRVQHHHAHAAACLAENGIAGRALSVVYDGTGYGDDGTLWGGEFFLADHYRFRRVAHLATMLLPGGETAIEHPWRAALGALVPLLGSAASSLFPEIRADDKDPVVELVSREIHCVKSSGMGRLFDAMSALLGIGLRRGYEGQPAILLEAAAMEEEDAGKVPGYRVPLAVADGMPVIDGAGILLEAYDDFRGGAAVSRVAARFHATVAEATVSIAAQVAEEQTVTRVSLSGGCFQNVILTERIVSLLRERGLTPLLHRLLPPSDESISYGQVVVAGMGRRETVPRSSPE